MIILTSNGLSNRFPLRQAGKYINSGRAALVVTADHEYKEKNHHVKRLTGELQSLGLCVDCFDFDTQSPSELLAYDVVEIMGGNPYYLLNSIKTHQFAEALKAFAQSRCLIGCSAGSVVLTPGLELIDIYTPEMNMVGLKDLSGLKFIDCQILPHYSKFLSRYDAFEERCSQYEKANGCAVVRLNDGEGVFIDNNISFAVRRNKLRYGFIDPLK